MAAETARADRQRLALTQFATAEALAHGFDLCRITTPERIPDLRPVLQAFVGEGYHGSMAWMEETLERRGHPTGLWPEVRSLVMVAMNYGPDEDPRTLREEPGRGAISVYARHRDYHDVMKGKLKALATRFAARAGSDVKVFVDTAPVMEKPLAAAAGLGWQGKHTNLVSRSHGSWLFLGSMFTTAELIPDAGEVDHCGSCRACLDACPTNAFPAPYRIDARRCISYLTIENKGPIPADLRPLIGNRIYGCDDCLAACPWNKFAQSAAEIRLKARADLKAPELADLLALDDAAFRAHFSASPIKRIGRDRFLRNVLTAAGNSGDGDLAGHCRPHLSDTSPLVRGAAAWAMARLLDAGAFAALAKQMTADEQDEMVLTEWRDALASQGES
ncbi:epoxyqueuosine reductase [Rhizobium sp. RU20A]|uniref:tRNA epoxyqueuosine(34) reductase QueG n=1 Tax=Rhizobium sp. RU20A TaxID=1907412 RepID=UPI0009543128|nr:tRNA epoxyqueuosine(34) reductase QueG [Rhizobium sp. RU20A]SIQ72934.1 epoxyqueuosine reductase [Rhizobium sp. RU20A]